MTTVSPASSDHSSTLVGVSAMLTGIATAAVTMRLGSRIIVLGGLCWEDALVILSWIAAVVFYVMVIIAAQIGLGKHWDQFDRENMAYFLKLITILSVCYTLSVILGKASVAALYLRIFGGRENKLVILNRALMLFLLCQAIEETAAVTIQCLPAVRHDESQAGSSCLNLQPIWWASFSCNLTTSILLFTQPITFLWQLDIRLNDRLTLAIITSIGLLIIIFSAIRQTAVSKIGNDPTHDYSLPIIWSEVEAGAVILCSCLPSFRQALQPIWARNLPQETHPGANTSNSLQLPSTTRALDWRAGKTAGPVRRSLSRSRRTKDTGREETVKITPLDRMAWIDSLAFQAVWLKGGQLGTRSHVEAAPPPTPTMIESGRAQSWSDTVGVNRFIARWKRGDFDGGMSTQDSATQPIRKDDALVGNGPPLNPMGITVTREFTYEVVECEESNTDELKTSKTQVHVGVDEETGVVDRHCDTINRSSVVAWTGAAAMEARPRRTS